MKQTLLKVFGGDALLALLNILLSLATITYVLTSLDQTDLQIQVQAVLAEETFKSKCIQLFTLAFVTFLVMCQIGFVKFPGAWSLREPFFYESPEFTEYIFYVLLATILCVYLVHLLPVYFGCLWKLFYELFNPTNWRNLIQWFRTNWNILLQCFVLCVATVIPYISLCDDSAFGSGGMRPGEGGNNTPFLIMLAYLLRFFHLWRVPPDTLIFDATTFVMGLKLGIQHLLLTMGQNIANLICLILMLRNLEYFPGLTSFGKAFAYLSEIQIPSQRVVALLEMFQQTKQHTVSVDNVWIISFFIVCFWSWLKSMEKKS